MAHQAPSVPTIPSSTTIRRRLQDIVKQRQEDLLRLLPQDAKLSIALDCWTSPFRQSFMAITGYFIDVNWNYREILLGFEPISGSHTGTNLSIILFDLFQEHHLEGRVLTMTTDNASNNNTLHDSIKEVLAALELPDGPLIERIPCMAHVIQLSLTELLGKMEAVPKNDQEEMDWTEADAKGQPQQENKEIVHTLNKVGNPYSNLIPYQCYHRFGNWQST